MNQTKTYFFQLEDVKEQREMAFSIYSTQQLSSSLANPWMLVGHKLQESESCFIKQS